MDKVIVETIKDVLIKEKYFPRQHYIFNDHDGYIAIPRTNIESILPIYWSYMKDLCKTSIPLFLYSTNKNIIRYIEYIPICNCFNPLCFFHKQSHDEYDIDLIIISKNQLNYFCHFTIFDKSRYSAMLALSVHGFS